VQRALDLAGIQEILIESKWNLKDGTFNCGSTSGGKII
jgi:hypothetical protein